MNTSQTVNHGIEIENGTLNFGFVNLPNGGFYVNYGNVDLRNISEEKFVYEMERICSKSKILNEVAKAQKLGFGNEEFNKSLSNKIAKHG